MRSKTAFFRGFRPKTRMSTEPLTVTEERLVPRSHRRDRIEVILSRSVGIVGIVFGLMALPVALEQRDILQPVWFWVTVVSGYGSLVLNVVASIIQRFVRSANVAVSLLWLLTMAFWPLLVVDPDLDIGGRPWPWFLASVAVAAAAVAYLKVRRPIAYLVMAVVAYGYVRLLPSGGGAPIDEMLLDVLSTITFGGAVITIVIVFRRASSAVDEAQSAALFRHSQAATQDAISRERVRVDALVHDSVLAALLEAARSTTPEAMDLSAKLAEEALGHLEAAAEVSSSTVEWNAASDLPDRLERAVGQLGGDVSMRIGALDGRMLPIAVSDALHSAAMQAVVNSLQHAGDDAARWITVQAVGSHGIRVEVGDTGVGFLSDKLPGARLGLRLGLRVSIIERVAAIGGVAEIDSSPGEGTIVTLDWGGSEAVPIDPDGPDADRAEQSIAGYDRGVLS